ncbi:MAG: polyprenyl synthetase family protein [Weeksellaceae bacterium]
MNIIEKYKNLVEEALEKHSFKTMEPKELYEPCDYILSLGGKRLRPVIAMLGSYIFDGKDEDAIKPALAIEFFHNFSLMHDDIMDEAPIRRGKETVHLKYGINTGILSGDSLLIESYKMFEDLPAEKFKAVTQLFSKTATELCEGQQYDMNFETQDEVSYEEYIQMISLKTSVLVGAAFQIGAIVAGAEKEDYEKLYEFGKNLGIAFQLKDDYLDVFGEKDFGKIHAGDIIENKKTILYIKALEEADKESLKELKYWYGIKTDNIDKVYAVEKIFKRLKVDYAVMSLIGLHTEKAMMNLNEIQVSDEKKSVLRELASSLIERQI